MLVVQEIFGVHEHIKDICRRLAKRGYFAVAPELYARQGDVSLIEDFREIISKVVSKVPDAQVMSDLDATAEWAIATKKGDGDKLAITGFCWGGRIVWLYAAHSPQVKAGAAWYGRLVGDKDELHPAHPVDLADALKAPVLGLYGGADTGIPLESVEKMRGALTAAQQKSEIVVFPDTPHGFYADYRPSYRKEQADDGWRKCSPGSRTTAWLNRADLPSDQSRPIFFNGDFADAVGAGVAGEGKSMGQRDMTTGPFARPDDDATDAGLRTMALRVAAVAILAFLPAIAGKWVNWDDDTNFLSNPNFRGLGWQQIAWAWQTTLLGVYQPLSWMFLEVQYCLWGLDARGYHIVSLGLHAINSVVLFFLCRLLVRIALPVLAKEHPLALNRSAGLAAALFAAHPLRAEVVAWVSCQPYLPSVLLVMLAALVYLQNHDPGRAQCLAWRGACCRWCFSRWRCPSRRLRSRYPFCC